MRFFELAFLSSISPQTLAVVLYLLGGKKGLKHSWLFVGGALFTSMVAGAVVAVGLADTGIHLSGLTSGHRMPGAYIVAGVVLLLFAGYVLWWHQRARSHHKKKDRERDSRRLERMVQSSWVALGVGLIFGFPGPGYALALAETSGHAPGFTIATVVIFSVISYSWGWIPIVWFMFDKDRAVRVLTGLRTGVAKHHIAIIVLVLAAVGLYLLLLGLLTL